MTSMGFDVAFLPVGCIELDSFGSVAIMSFAKEKEQQFGGKLFKRMKAEIKKRMMNKKRMKRKKGSVGFCYDPFSYALNFDSGNSGFFCL